MAEQMQAKIAELEGRLKENSQNSNRPPSSDGFPKRKSGMPKKGGLKGGQVGHQGDTLRQVEAPDVVLDGEPQSCECGAPEWVSEAQIAETRQVFDLPEPRLEVVEYRRVKRTCKCGKTVSGKFPEGVLGPAQYGLKVQAMVSLLSVQGCLSHRKIGTLFADLYGFDLNEATPQKMVKRTAEKMPMEEIKAGLSASEVVNFDETGLREEGKLQWLHNASTALLTYQFVHAKRGREAMQSEKSSLPEFSGVGVHDCWASYFGFAGMQHALCNAHILRELTGLMETSASQWGGQMKELLWEMYEKSEKGTGVIAAIGAYEQRYFEIISTGEAEEPPPEKNQPERQMEAHQRTKLVGEIE